jgi:hypothetical protein
MPVGPEQGSDSGKADDRRLCLGGAAMAASKPNKYEGQNRPAPRSHHLGLKGREPFPRETHACSLTTFEASAREVGTGISHHFGAFG